MKVHAGYPEMTSLFAAVIPPSIYWVKDYTPVLIHNKLISDDCGYQRTTSSSLSNDKKMRCSKGILQIHQKRISSRVLSIYRS